VNESQLTEIPMTESQPGIKLTKYLCIIKSDLVPKFGIQSSGFQSVVIRSLGIQSPHPFYGFLPFKHYQNTNNNESTIFVTIKTH
jgi:hypothetical protein